MRSENHPDGQSSRPATFTEQARRSQLIDCTIEAVVSHGYAGATLARVAELAGVSKGVVLYHFANKAELLEATVREVYGRGIRHAKTAWFDRHAESATPPELLRAYLQTNLGYIAAHPAEIAATIEVTRTHRDAEGQLVFSTGFEEALYTPLEEILRAGQASGHFRDFAPRVMAISVRRVIDGFSFQVLADPDLDTVSYSAQVVALFEHATRADATR